MRNRRPRWSRRYHGRHRHRTGSRHRKLDDLLDRSPGGLKIRACSIPTAGLSWLGRRSTPVHEAQELPGGA